MTDLLAIVRSAGEAVAALAGGADRVAILGDAGKRHDPSAETGQMIWPVQGDTGPVPEIARTGSGPVWLPLRPAWFAGIGGALAARRTVVGCISAEDVGRNVDWAAEACRLGLDEVLVATPPFSRRRLLDVFTIPDLAELVRAGHAAGLRLGFSGALEVPDVPRLQALRPDVIGFGTALRDEADGFDGRRLEAIRSLMGSIDVPAPSSRAVDATDRIFVRDWTIPMSIGAYARERGQNQRVRWAVEACVASTGPDVGLGGVVSYDLITDAIARLAVDHVDLVEELAERLAGIVLAHPHVLSLDITVEKLDVGPGSVGCRIFRPRATV